MSKQRCKVDGCANEGTEPMQLAFIGTIFLCQEHKQEVDTKMSEMLNVFDIGKMSKSLADKILGDI